MGKHVWIGPRGAEQWFKAPAPRTAFQAVGWSSTTQSRNGMFTGRKSRNTHMRYELSWPIVDTAAARVVEDWFYGTYGDGKIYWLDPMLQNQLPARWSYPGLGCTDGMPIYGSQRPQAVNTAPNSKGLPKKSARYVYDALTAGASPEECYVPVPPGHAAHIGVHAGVAGGASSIVTAERYNGAVSLDAAPTVLPAIQPSDSTMHNTVIPQSGSMTGIGLKVNPGQSWPIATNLFTNPNFVAGSGTVEVRRNHFIDPLLWGPSWEAIRSTKGVSAGVLTITVTSVGAYPRVVSNAVAVSPGETVAFAVQMEQSGGVHTMLAQFHDANGSQVGSPTYGQVSANGVIGGRLTSTATAPAGATQMRVWIGMPNDTATGATAKFSAPIIEKGPTTGPFFAPGLPSPDPDLAPAWTGTANASSSVLTGVPVAGVSRANCLAIRSSKFGGSMRLIADSNSTDSYAYLILPTPARTAGTFIATRHQEAAIASPNARRGALGVEDTRQFYDYAEVQVGSEEMRISYPALTSYYHARFYHGGAKGQPDVYWTLGGLFAGDYTGPAFSGDSPNAVWNGAANASTSTLNAVTPTSGTLAGIAVEVLPIGQSPAGGKFVRGGGANGCEMFEPPATAPISAYYGKTSISAILEETGR